MRTDGQRESGFGGVVLLLCLAMAVTSTSALDGIDSTPKGSFTLEQDTRKEITITSFGLGPNGNFSILIQDFKVRGDVVHPSVTIGP